VKRATKKQPRIVHVECETATDYRWLRQHARGATLTDTGEFSVTNESEWAQSLSAARGKEVQ